MTAPAPTRLLHAPWAVPADLPATRPALPGGDDEWAELCWQASELLYLLTGRQWAGEVESTVVLDPPTAGARGQCWPVWRPSGGWLGAPAPARPVREGYVVVSLPDPPVTGVEGVVIGGDPFTEWTAWLPVGQLERSDGRAWPLDGTCVVRFRHGLAPPAGGVAAAVELTLELGKSRVADGSCKLPRRITNIQREGVTVSLLDAGEHLDEGRTGLLNVDLWIRSVNPNRLPRRARAWSPDQPRTRKVSTP